MYKRKVIMKITVLHILSIIFFLQLAPSCKKEKALCPTPTPPKPEVKINENFTEIWSVKMSKGVNIMGTLVTDSNVIYWTDFVGGGYRDDMVAFNKRTGDTAWHKLGNWFSSKYKLIGDYVYFSQNYELHCINPIDGNELWRVTGAGELADYLAVNGSIYAFFKNSSTTYLYKIDPLTGSKTTEYTINASDRGGFFQNPSGIAHWQHPNGNDIIFIQSSGLKASVGKGEYYAIDITADSMYWDLGNYFNSVAIGFPPLIDGNNVIIGIGFTEGNASLNLVTKTTNWKVAGPISSHTGGGYAVLKNGKIFKEVGNMGHFNVLDVSNGNQVATHKNIGTSGRRSPLKVYNNKVYFTTTDIIGVIDCSTNNFAQKILHDEQIGNTSSYPDNGLDVDQTNGYIYTSRGPWFVCLKEK